ncbi:2,6-dihydropseudooxynicotine hydrolase [Hirsutella rhossiliensis]
MAANASGTPLPLNEDPLFDFGILRPLSLSVYDGADIAEVLTAARDIVPGDFESFAGAFGRLARSVYDRAAAVARGGFPFSARTAFFSAATYFRAADFFLHGDPADPRLVDLWDRQTDAFDHGLALLSPPGQRLTIRAPDFDIPAIWLTPTPEHGGKEQQRRRPTLVVGNGYDGAQEELYHVIGLAALERGYNVLSYEGPGQPTVRRQQGLGFIPDWERVVGPVMDHVLRQTAHVDPSAVGLLGLSFGGYLAPRAAAFDDRFAAVMALDGVWEFGPVLAAGFGPEMMRLHAAGKRERFDALARQRFLGAGAPTRLRWGLEQGLWAFGTPSPYELVTLARNYTLAPVAHRIATPTFVGDAQRDLFFAGQARQLAAALGPRWAHRHEFADADAAGAHAGVGALRLQSQVVLDWFQGVLDGRAGGGRRGGERDL